MTARNRSRTFLVGAAVAALLAPLAIVAAFASPASAAPGKPHEVYIYKVEKHVTMSGEYPDQYLHDHLYCNPGDIALDGMWRVDHVDQAQPPEFVGDERDVYATASYGDTSDLTKWHFRIHNYADGDAQLKLWVTCIRGTVEQAYGHSHNVVVTHLAVDSSHNGLAADTPDSTVTAFDGVGNCPSGSIAVAPGFNVNMSGVEEDDHRIRLVGSWPFDTNYNRWHWEFIVTDPGADIDVYLRCLQIKTTSFGAPKPHAHNLMWAFRPNTAIPWDGDLQFLSVVGMQERRINCDDGSGGAAFQDYKAAVGAFKIANPWHVWFLGMDPRPKQRAYRFWWDGTGSNQVRLGAICIRARTSKQVAP